MWLRVASGWQQFVSGGNQRDTRPASNQQAFVVHGGREAECGEAETRALDQADVPLAEIKSARADIKPRCGCRREADLVKLPLGLLLDDDAIRPRGKRCSGEDANRFAIVHGFAKTMPGGRLADDTKPNTLGSS